MQTMLRDLNKLHYAAKLDQATFGKFESKQITQEECLEQFMQHNPGISRKPNMRSFVAWISSLGYDVVYTNSKSELELKRVNKAISVSESDMLIRDLSKYRKRLLKEIKYE